jgi:putative MATE family efflux protein
MDLEVIERHVPKAILKFAIPSIIGMILTSAISIIDGYFIGNYIGGAALTAVNLGLPIVYLFLAVGIMVGVGGVSQASRLLGAKQVEKSVAVFNQTILTSIGALVILAILLAGLLNSLSDIFNADASVKGYFIDYYEIMILIYPIMLLNMVMGMFVRAEGKPVVSMILSVILVLFNSGLDYLFVTQSNLGIQGIAIASVISIVVGLLYLLAYFNFKAKVFSFRRFTFSKSVFESTFKNGSSEFIGQLSICITTIALNFTILREGGVDGMAAFSVVGYSAFLFTMIVFGFGQGASPLISFSSGANEHALAKKVRNTTSTYVLVLGIFAMFLLMFGADHYSQVFVHNESVGRLVRSGIPIFSVVFLFMGFNIVTSFYFTCIGHVKASALISAARGLVILMACILIFPAIWGMQGVWFIAPVTEMLTLFLSLLCITKSDKLLVH